MIPRYLIGKRRLRYVRGLQRRARIIISPRTDSLFLGWYTKLVCSRLIYLKQWSRDLYGKSILEINTVYKPPVKITTVDFVIFTTKDLTYVCNSICKYIWVLNNDGHLVEAAFCRSCFSFLDVLESHRWRHQRGNQGMKFSGLLSYIWVWGWYHYWAYARDNDVCFPGLGVQVSSRKLY